MIISINSETKEIHISRLPMNEITKLESIAKTIDPESWDKYKITFTFNNIHYEPKLILGSATTTGLNYPGTYTTVPNYTHEATTHI
jgi:hypothetical protein